MKAETPSATARQNPSLVRRLSLLALDRTACSSERSLLSWVRTSASLYAFGFSMSKFIDYLQAREEGLEHSFGLRRLGVFMIAMGAMALTLAMFEHLRRIRTMKKLGLHVPHFSLPAVAAATLIAVGIATLIPLMGLWPG